MLGNTNNGSFCGLSDRGVDFVKMIEQEKSLSMLDKIKNKQLLKFMEKSGFFCDSKNVKIQSAYLHVTNKCNLKCVGCYSYDETRNAEEDLDFSEMKNIINKLKVMGVDILVISGGEPLIRKDLSDIVKYAKCDAEIKQVIVLSNGLFLTEQRALELCNYIDEFSISIDCYNENCVSYIRRENRYQDIIKAIEIAKKYFKRVNILPTLHRNNIENVEDYINLAKKLGVSISFSILTCGVNSETSDFIPTRSQLEYLGNTFKPGEQLTIRSKHDIEFSMTACKKCGIAEETISIASNGKVYPCHMCHDEKLVLGNICKDSTEQILIKRDFIIKGVDVDNIEVCKDCKYRYLCGAGCRARAYMYDSLFSPDPYCPMFKKYLQSFEEFLINNYKDK